MKGGYRIINLKKVALTSGKAETIPGTYESAENSFGKATMISGLVVGGVSYPDFNAPFKEGNKSYSATVSIAGTTINFTIAEGDSVTVTVS